MRVSLWPAVLVGLLIGLGVSGGAGVQRRAQNGDVIRGVNVGGWLLTEEWSVADRGMASCDADI